MFNKINIRCSIIIFLALSGFSVNIYSAPVLEIANSDIQSPLCYTPKVALSEDGRFFLVACKIFDLYTNQSLYLDTYTSGSSALAMSSSGRFIVMPNGIVDLKYGTATTGLPGTVSFSVDSQLNGTIVSDSGRFISYRYQPSGYTTHGYIYDQKTGQSSLGTPLYGTSNQLVPVSVFAYPSDMLISGDGKKLFWGVDGVAPGYGPMKPNTRDLLAHQWGVNSTVNPRVSNCDGCGDGVTNRGSDAYQYDVSFNGNIAAFRGYGDYGFTTADGETSNGRFQVYTRDMQTLEVDLISADDAGNIEQWATGTFGINYEFPSISSDGRFVVFSGGAATYIRDRFAKKKEVLDAASSRAIISGNGKSILIRKADGWYSLPNPYLVTTTNFASHYLFVNMLFSGNGWAKFDHMLLTDNHVWTGYIDFDGIGSGSFKFELGGQWDISGNYIPGSSSGIGYGDDNADGIASYGESIAINLTQGSGRYKVTFNDQSFQYSIKKLATVNISCFNGITVIGQSVYAVGNIPELGSWSPANAIKLSPTAYPTWTGSVSLPENTNIEWKCIKRNELNASSQLVWEPGNNNQFNPSNSQTINGAF